jgi:anthranilate phosphoribosyltransferase/tryptophanyl-tRNA synthetase
MDDKKSMTLFLADCTSIIQNRGVLSRAVARQAFSIVLSKEPSSADLYWGSLFSAMMARGPDIEETLGLVDAILDLEPGLPRSYSQRTRLISDRPTVACTGSGKETFKTFNISTCAAFIAAACGVAVVKPCSESTSAMSGASDVLMNLGIGPSSSRPEAAEALNAHGICFIDFRNLAPRYTAKYNGLFYHFHPLSFIAPPLCVPFQVDAILHGIADENVVHGAELLRAIGYSRGAVVTTTVPANLKVDELLSRGRARLALLTSSGIFEQTFDGPPPTSQEVHALRHRASHRENADAVVSVLDGTADAVLKEAACWNAAALLLVAGLVPTLDEGVTQARHALIDGAPKALLANCRAHAKRTARHQSVSRRASPASAIAIEEESRAAFAGLQAIQVKEGYEEIPAAFSIAKQADPNYFRAKFLCHDRAEVVNEVPIERGAIVTGFGPTSSPTAGTLSVLLKAISMQRETGLYTEIVISDLGAWNSRNLNWREIERNTDQFIEFIKICGFSEENGKVRTHRDHFNLVSSGLVAKYLQDRDFSENHEATDRLYDLLQLRGSQFSIQVDALYTVTDILKPLMEGRERVLMLSGIEEHYFTQLAKKVVERMTQRAEEFVPKTAAIGALYARIIGGLYPHAKMSKSIAASSISVGDTQQEIERKIMRGHPQDEGVIIQMIELVSDWSAARIAAARAAYEQRMDARAAWTAYKQAYLEYFLRLAREWERLC